MGPISRPNNRCISLAEVIQKFEAAVIEVCSVHGIKGGIAQFPKKEFIEEFTVYDLAS